MNEQKSEIRGPHEKSPSFTQFPDLYQFQDQEPINQRRSKIFVRKGSEIL